MVRAWYMNNDIVDFRDECQFKPNKSVDLDVLKEKTGVLYWKLDATNYETDAEFNRICSERGYSYRDLIEISAEKLPEYEKKLSMFYTEHLHSDEEIRFVLEGSGYFDVRDRDDQWIRILVEANDLIVLPAGIYHRFTPDHKNYAKVCRLFVGEPVWTAINRPADEHPARLDYIKSLAN